MCCTDGSKQDRLCDSEFCSALATFQVPPSGSVLDAFKAHCGKPPYRSLHVGKRNEIQNRRQCPSCRLIAATISTTPALAAIIGSEDISIFYPQTAAEPFVSMLQICPHSTDERARDWRYGECILICPSKFSPGCSGRVIRDVPVDGFKIRRWLNLCDTLHDDLCKPSFKREEKSSMDLLRLIDVADLKIVTQPWSTTYFALSYVWGGVTQLCLLRSNREILEKTGSLEKVGPQLSRTVRDAIKFVRLIGGRYLWVDCLCLTNDDPEEMERGIKSMYKIYDSAYATIVAANGDSADSGLPRIRRGPPPVRPVEMIKPNLTMTSVTYLDECIPRSAWYKRGWT